MEAKEFVRERTRMLDSLKDVAFKGFPSCDRLLCENCLMNNAITGCISDTEEAVDIVEQWSKRHLVKTIKDDFLEKYPNAWKYDDGIPCFCPKHLGYKVECNCKCHNCWNTPLEVK